MSIELSVQRITMYPHDVDYSALHVRMNTVPPPHDIKRVLIVCLDVSGSMQYHEELLLNTIRRLYDGVSMVNSQCELVVIPFSEEVHCVWSSVGGSIDDILGKIKCSGRTNIGAALTEACEQSVSREGWKWVVVLTDGQPTAGILDTRTLEDIAGGIQGKIRCIGYGSDYDTSLLSSMGRMSHIESMDNCPLVTSGILLEVLESCAYDLSVSIHINGVDIKSLTHTIVNFEDNECLVRPRDALFIFDKPETTCNNPVVEVICNRDGSMYKTNSYMDDIWLNVETEGKGWIMTHPRNRQLELKFYRQRMAEMISDKKNFSEICRIWREWFRYSDMQNELGIIFDEVSTVFDSVNVEGSSDCFLDDAHCQNSYSFMGTESMNVW